MRPSSGQLLCVCVASLYLSGSCEVLGLAVATMLTLVSDALVNRFRETDEPAVVAGPLVAPAPVRLR